MSRYVNQIQVPCDPNALTQPIVEYMRKEGFELVNYKGEQIWKKGFGLMMGPQYLSVQYGPNFVKIEAFTKWAILPGVYFSEMGINGFVAAIPKAQLAKRVRALESYVHSLWQQLPQNGQ